MGNRLTGPLWSLELQSPKPKEPTTGGGGVRVLHIRIIQGNIGIMEKQMETTIFY